MRAALRNGVVAGALALVTALATAPAADAVDTDATFTISAAGGLGISAPASTVALGGVDSGTTTLAASLGTVTVTDDRAAVIAEWTATATGTHFDLQDVNATPASDPNHRVANTAIAYAATPTVTSGTGTVTVTAGTLDLTNTIVFAGSGSNVVSWDPTLTFTLLPSQSAGTYKGTVTHSVS